LVVMKKLEAERKRRARAKTSYPDRSSPSIVNCATTTVQFLVVNMASMPKAAMRTMRTAARPMLSRRLPALTRQNSAGPADIPEPPIPMTGIISRGPGVEMQSAAMIRDNPDYNVAVDYRTSYGRDPQFDSIEAN
jgi:hypothetical protein